MPSCSRLFKAKTTLFLFDFYYFEFVSFLLLLDFYYFGFRFRFRVVPAGSGRFRVGSAFYIHPNYLTIGSCFSVHYRVMEHAGSLESTKEA